jgi:uncharacterized protein (TIRG00374 family)
MDAYKPKINLRRMVFLIVMAITLMAVAGWLLARENFYQMFEAIKSANGLLIAAAIAINFLSVAAWAGRWQTALSFINCKVSFGTRYLILCATVFLNNITPGMRVGGDPFGRCYMVHRLENTSYSSGLASIIGEFALVPLIVVSFLMAGLVLQYGKESFQLSFILIAVWALAALGIVFLPRLFFKKRIAIKGVSSITNRILGWFGKRRNIREAVKGITAFYSSTYTMMDERKKMLLMGGWSLFIGAFDVLQLYVIFMALGYYPTLPVLLIAAPLPIIAGLIPLLPGGLIIVEGSLISVLTLLGVPLPLALAATVIQRAISFALNTIVGAGVFSYLGVRMAAKPKVQS